MPQHSSDALDRLPLRTTKQAQAALRNSTQSVDLRENAQEIASHIFDDAVEGSRLTNQSIAFALKVSDSIVGRWRNPNAREFPSLLQLQQLGELKDVGQTFLCEFNKACTRRNRLGRRVLQSVLDAVGDLAVAVGEQ